MSEERSVKQYVGLMGKGALIGVANTVPGVSGGTIAVVTGIYDELMESIARFVKNWKFLAALIIGAGAGILLFARVIEFLMESYPYQTLYTFIGLILGGIPFLWGKADFTSPPRIGWIAAFLISLGLILLMGRGGEPGVSKPITTLTPGSAVRVFLAGVAAAGAMIIPGVSGSFLLLLMGMYSTFIGAVNDMNLPLIFFICLGMAAGILVIARAMAWLLRTFPQATYAAIFGLIIGSLITLWPGFLSGLPGFISLLFIPLGAGAGYFLGDR